MGEKKEPKYIIPEDGEKTEKTNEVAMETEKDTTEGALKEINEKLDILIAATGKAEE